MNVVARILDGPVAPLAIHFGAGVDEPLKELLFMEVPGRAEGDPMRWVRLEPDFAALEDPDARFEWYDLAADEPYAELDTNALWPYVWREGFVTIVTGVHQCEGDEPIEERVARLHDRASAAMTEHELGEPLQKTMTMICDRCGAVWKLNFDRFGIDWPDQLEGWAKGPEGDLCPECAASS